ncbi:hypothetical protein [Flavicella sp.]|uniref:hypothetical protein n=1 Tax=Flavicella sp. TaxID=2957742 RepID=UPI0030163A8B
MDETNKISFDFIKEIKEPGVYQLLFPKKEVGLAVMLLFDKIENNLFIDGKFTENDIHDTFAKIVKTGERYPKEIYSGHIAELQEYFLDYNQESQKYYFKDYAYRFHAYAKKTLEGNFSPTRIAKICSHLTHSLRQKETLEDLKFWLEEEFKKNEPDLRGQIDFLDRQIVDSVNKLKSKTEDSNQNFIDILKEVENNLDNAQIQSGELASAYSETKVIRTILEKKQISDSEINDLISDVHHFIKYLNERLDSIDRKLDRIQPKIRQLFATLNRPQFNSKVEKFIHFLLKESKVDNKRVTILPNKIENPITHINTPNFTILERERELFPPQSKKIKKYSVNKKVIEKNKQKVLKVLEQQDLVRKWEYFILSEIDLKGSINLSKTFFNILDETKDGQVAVSTIYNIIRTARKEKSLNFEMQKIKEKNNINQEITLWKMKVSKKE